MKAKSAPKRKRTDWEAVEKDYRTGKFTLRDLGDKYLISHSAVYKQSVCRGWSVASTRQYFEPTHRSDDFASPGFLYVIYLEDSSGKRFSKIGIATNLENRMKSHQCSSPFELKLAVSYFVGNMRREESALHGLFFSKRVRGEWFELNQADLEVISRRSLLNG